jgi:tetratricopeptide (TPR) repeat protein
VLKGFLCLPFLALLMTAAAASDEQVPELRIQVIAGGGVSAEYSASIERLQDRRPIRSEALPADGVWRFRDVPYGEYRLTIRSSDGAPVYEQGITVNSQASTVMLSLPVKMPSSSVSGTVSVGQLLHPIDKKALKSFKESQNLIEKGDFESAARQLEKAIEASPSYADAYGSLAAVHIKMGRYVQALTEISHAISVAGPNARDLSNRALAYYDLEDYAASIKAARWALRLDPDYDPAHFVLGATLAIDKGTMAESVPHLERAARTIMSAKAILAIVQKARSHD